MNLLKITVVSTLLATSTFAAAESGFGVSGNVALSTDYIWRGVSQTNNHPAISGGFDAAYTFGAGPSLYAGVWDGNVDLGESTIEVDMYAGISGDVGETGLGWDLGILRFQYPHESDLNFTEAYFGLSYAPVEQISFSAMYYYGLKIEHTDPGNYTDMGIDIDLLSLTGATEDSLPSFFGGLALSLHAGHYDLKRGGSNYWDWKAGLSTTLWGVDAEVAYTDTDDKQFGSAGDEHLLFTLSKSL